MIMTSKNKVKILYSSGKFLVIWHAHMSESNQYITAFILESFNPFPCALDEIFILVVIFINCDDAVKPFLLSKTDNSNFDAVLLNDDVVDAVG